MKQINHPKEAFKAASQFVRLMDKERPPSDYQELEAAAAVIRLEYHSLYCKSGPFVDIEAVIDLAQSCIAQWEYACFLERRS